MLFLSFDTREATSITTSAHFRNLNPKKTGKIRKKAVFAVLQLCHFAISYKLGQPFFVQRNPCGVENHPKNRREYA